MNHIIKCPYLALKVFKLPLLFADYNAIDNGTEANYVNYMNTTPLRSLKEYLLCADLEAGR